MMKSSSASILNRVKIPKDGKLLLAFSGGEDSLFLLYALSLLAPYRSSALYVNHNIRPVAELEREIELNRRNALSLGIPFDVVEVERDLILIKAKENNIGVEAAAREERYALLEKYAHDHGFDYILTAHHEDDQTETVLMRIMEHSPFYKWGGIRERDGILLRPMLGIKKSEIKEVIKEAGLEYSTDSTNADTALRRNYIRKNILPLISEKEKAIIASIASNIVSFNIKPVDFLSSSSLFVSFKRDEYLSKNKMERERSLYMMFSLLGEKERLSRRYLEEVNSTIERGEGRTETKAYVVYSRKDTVKGYRKINDAFSSPFNGEETRLPYNLSVSYSLVDHLSLEIPTSVLSSSILRLPRPGDRINLVDGERKISSLLKEFKIPYCLLLEYNNEIVAFFSAFLGGRDRLSSSYKGKKGQKLSIIGEIKK